MSDITSQSLTSLVKNIKEEKLSSEDVTKAFVERSEKSKELNS
jgi:aspartyl-tRNA(Asn)/glutamyl-tRNA(Gln) amidotransferase subunit A